MLARELERAGHGARLVDLGEGVVLFDAPLFEDARSDRWSEDALLSLLEVLAAANDAERPPPLYASGVRYRAEDQKRERWRVGTVVLSEDMEADCEDLAAMRVSELRRSGERAGFDLLRQEPRIGELLYHIRVRRGDGRIEDPSRVLGMR